MNKNSLFFLITFVTAGFTLLLPVRSEELYRKRYRHNFGQPVISHTVNEDFEGQEKKVFKRQDHNGNRDSQRLAVTPQGDEDDEVGVTPTTTTTTSTTKVTRKTVPTTVTTMISMSTEDATGSSTTVSTSPATDVPVLVPNSGGSVPNQYFCLCDLKISTCDMNCCCDPDCNANEKRLFTGCEGSLIYDSAASPNQEQSCVKSYVMYRENIPYRVDRSDPSLFCVVRENIKKIKEFSNEDMSRIMKRISHGKIDSKPKYNWDRVTPTTSMFNPVPYKYGSPLYVIALPEDEYKEEVLRLPAAYHTDVCSVDQPVLYLQEFESICTVPLSHPRTNCILMNQLDANNYVKNYSVILNPGKTADNLTDYPLQNVIVARVCFNSMQRCRDLVPLNSSTEESSDYFEVPDVEFPSPVGNFRSRTCQNVLAQLNLTVIHGGIDGIRHVVAHALVTDVPFSSTYVRQSFNVKFIWEGSTKKPNSSLAASSNSTAMLIQKFLDLKSLPRSGNPGYLVGKPLILGQKVVDEIPSNGSSTPKLVQRMKVPHASHNFMIQGAGDCPTEENSDRFTTPRNPVLFGYEHISTCKLDITPFTHCSQLQSHISSVILGMDFTSFANSQFYVAAYGSPDAFPTDWVPVTFIDSDSNPMSSEHSAFNLLQNGCESIRASFHITVTFAYVGPVDQPQAKITGVFFQKEASLKIPSSEGSSSFIIPYIPVTTTVSFVDVTGNPVVQIATWPVVSIQLPADFFYPFSSSTSAPSSASGHSKRRNNSQSLITLLGFVVVLLRFAL